MYSCINKEVQIAMVKLCTS